MAARGIPYISIITPTYNAGPLLEKTVASVLEQTTQDIEHIIVDNNSTDNTRIILERVCQRYSCKYIRERDTGISNAFNKGVDAATGKWILFLGAGDKLSHRQVLEQIIPELVIRETEYLVWGNIKICDSEEREVRAVSGKFKKQTLKRYMCIPHQASFHNNKLFERFGQYDESLRVAMDYDLALRIYDYIDIERCYIDVTISKMLQGGVSQTGKGGLLEFMEVQKKNKVHFSGAIPLILYHWGSIKYWIKSSLPKPVNSFIRELFQEP